MKLILENIGL